jgi:hypothetical protein
MTFKEAQFIYDNLCEPEYPDENQIEQDYDYEPDQDDDEDLNAECRWW